MRDYANNAPHSVHDCHFLHECGIASACRAGQAGKRAAAAAHPPIKRKCSAIRNAEKPQLGNRSKVDRGIRLYTESICRGEAR
jgi:hypothetical protein